MSDNNESSFNKKSFIIVTIVVVAVIILLFAFYFMEGPSSGYSLKQFTGIFVAAALSGAVTLLLLWGQTDIIKEQRKGEAKRDKDVKIYSNKILAFSMFNKAVWQNEVDYTDPAAFVKTLETIRRELFSKVLMYLSSEEINEIVNIIDPKDPEGPENKENNENTRGKGYDMPKILSSIVSILNDNAERTLSEYSDTKDKDNDQDKDEDKSQDKSKSKSKDPAYSESCQDLWNAFSNWIHSFDGVPEEEAQETEKNEVETVEEKPWTFNVQAWHFCMLSSLQTEQMKKNNLYELSLVEYGQTWRTGFVKQVKPGDIVFLFRGNKRYLGVYKAIGWRALYYSKDEQGRECVREEVSEGIQKKVVLEGDTALMCDNAVNERLKQYDFYWSFGDGSTSCANVVVEELSFVPDGVVTPNTTYRPTISRYYWVYAGKLLKVFLDADPQARPRFEKLMPGFLKENNL